MGAITKTKKIQDRINSGFTIVELLIVIVIIAILAAITITVYSGIQARAEDSKRQSDIRQLGQLIESFHIRNGYYPPWGASSGPEYGLRYPSWRQTNIPEIKDSLLTPPGASGPALINNKQPDFDSYGYHNDGSCVGTGTNVMCPKMRLYWRSKVSGDVVYANSLSGW